MRFAIDKGSMLVQLMITVGIVGIVTIGVQQYFKSFSSLNKNTQEIAVTYELDGIASNPAAIRISATRNTTLQNCLASQSCTTHWTQFELLNTQGRSVTSSPQRKQQGFL